MKKIIAILALLCLFGACDKEKSKTVFVGDIMFFAEIPMIPDEGESLSVKAITTKTIDTETTHSWEWQVWCVERHHLPEYRASIVIDKTRSTAIEGVDFRLEGTNIVFDSEDVLSKNVKLELLSGKLSAPKMLVLKLNYGYEDINPLESRVKNTLVITLQ